MKLKKFSSFILIVSVIAFYFAPFINLTEASQLTTLKAVFGRLKGGTTNADSVVITFASPTGIQAGSDTITITFSADFTVAAEDVNNFDIGLGDSGTCSTASYTDETIALAPSATEWGVDVTGNVITLSPETDDTLTAGFCVKVEMGTAATTGAASTIVNGDVDNDDTITIAGDFNDDGVLAVDLIADDQVRITATVDPTITFTIGDNDIGFGTLTTANGRWADSDATGEIATTPAIPTVAHNMTIATNATSGYIISYNGATLTSGGDTISVATITDDSDGTTNSEQFALSVSTNGDATVTTGYDDSDTTAPDWSFVAGVTTPLITELGPTATETVSVSYLANIGGATEAGSYGTTLTYVATASF